MRSSTSRTSGGDWVYPLSVAVPGKKYIIVAIQARNHAVKRLAQLGLLKNTPVFVIKNLGRGPILVEARNSKIVLGRGLANKIIVQPLN